MSVVGLCWFLSDACRDPKGSLARVTEMSQPLPTQYSQPVSVSSMLKERRIEISQIGQQKAVSRDYLV